MATAKPGSWVRFSHEMNLDIVSARLFIEYLQEHDVRFFQKDVKWMVKQIREGRPFTAADLPNTVRPEDSEAVTRLLNVIVGYYERQNQKKARQRQKVLDARKQIPDAEVDRLLSIFERYGQWLRSDDKRQAKLESFTSINNWLKKTMEEREQWFQRVEEYAENVKFADERRSEEKRKQREAKQREDYQRFNQNRDYYRGILRGGNERMQAYITLGLPFNASQEEVKKTWKRLVLENHPDRGGDAQRFIEINGAYRAIVG